LAHEYAELQDPEGFYFEEKEFEKLANFAEELYEVPTGKDGIPEKLEAKGKLNALRAYMNYVNALNQ
jgi:hypothetical protein